MSKKLDRHALYERCVQAPEVDIDLVKQVYRRLRGKAPLTLREDFCGTGWTACESVKQGPRHRAVAVDLSREAVAYGRERHRASLLPSERSRIQYRVSDVRRVRGRFDVVLALNFSYGVFKRRQDLLAYFRGVRASLGPGGLFFLDLFGGTESQIEHVNRSRRDGIRYEWECKQFNVVNQEGIYAIHLQAPGGRWVRNAFVYDWRVWSASELSDLLKEAEFKRSHFYHEGDDGRGGGNGRFKPTAHDENCEAWHAYLVAQR